MGMSRIPWNRVDAHRGSPNQRQSQFFSHIVNSQFKRSGFADGKQRMCLIRTTGSERDRKATKSWGGGERKRALVDIICMICRRTA